MREPVRGVIGRGNPTLRQGGVEEPGNPIVAAGALQPGRQKILQWTTAGASSAELYPVSFHGAHQEMGSLGIHAPAGNRY
ncbi:MAG: hypothetical protein COX51_03235 [Syntrophobacteraceae bacterium CG23_combo_of_CG06-09_8_20_14_all_50_8]|nr:MAG: hypothetical protein COX51_03235 [Syntrophobacteraceae bacterium CG23_combo_of_CG06-09_8_20_14_all_50_8]